MFSIYFSTQNNIGALLVSLFAEFLVVSDTQQVLNKYLLSKQMEVAVSNRSAQFPGWLKESNEGLHGLNVLWCWPVGKDLNLFAQCSLNSH